MTCKYFWAVAAAACCAVTQAEARAEFEYFNDSAVTTVSAEDQPMPGSVAAPPAGPASPSDSTACPACDCAAAGSACGNGSCCGDMPSCIDESKPCWMCIAGAEATYLAPQFKDCGCPQTGIQGRDYANVDGHWDVGARIWFGFENDCGNGVRARYWQIEGCENASAIETPNLINFDTITAFQKYEAYTIDLEYTKRVECNCWDLLGSVGVRYASMNRNEGFSNYSETNGYAAWTDANYNYHGTGLTVGLEGRHPLGDMGFSFYGNVRGSVLWGPSKQAGQSLLETTGATGYQLAEIDEDSRTAWIFESQVGIEWAKYLECVKGTAFARLMFEYQHWDIDSQSYSLSQNLDGTGLQLESLNPNVDLYGVTFAVGVTR